MTHSVREIRSFPSVAPWSRLLKIGAMMIALVMVMSCGASNEATTGQVGRDRQAAGATSTDARFFDVYDKGALVAQLEFEKSDKAFTRFKFRVFDVKDRAWTDWSVARADADSGAEFIAGPIRFLPARLAKIQRASWQNVDAVGLPGDDHTFVKRERLSADTPDGAATATYWAARDQSVPLDLIINDDNDLLAGVDPYHDRVFVRQGFENFTTLADWRDPQMSQPAFGYRALPLVMMETRAGYKLATRVYLPGEEGDGPFPALLVRTPYGVTNLIENYEHFVTRGYAVVLQATRGTSYWDPKSRSEGSWNMMLQEVPDGEDAMNWIVSQPWSDGAICSDGISYYGYTQWALSIANHPAYKCMIAESSMGTPFSDQPFMGGTMIQGMAYYVFWMHDRPLAPGKKWADVFLHRPLIDIDEFGVGADLPIWNRFFEQPLNDEFWASQNWYAGDHERNFGSLQISGWFDDDYPGTRSNWELMQRKGTKANKLIIGPWKHSYNRDRRLNGYSFGEYAVRPDIHLNKIRFLDHHLKGVENEIGSPAVEYFMLGDNEWRQAATWPPKNIENTKFFLHSAGSANITSADGTISLNAPEGDEPNDEFVYDPQDPVRNWADFDALKRWEDVQSFPYDFRDIERRQDVATYTSEPLEESLSIAGNILVNLHASTDVLDTDWWAHISDVAPDGTSTRLGVGVIRARFRNLEDPEFHAFGENYTEEELLSGDINDVVEYKFSIPGVANTFHPGHRIRIAIFNSLEGYSFPNSNTGGDEGRATTTVPASIVIHHSEDAPSHVLLPAAPSERH